MLKSLRGCLLACAVNCASDSGKRPQMVALFAQLFGCLRTGTAWSPADMAQACERLASRVMLLHGLRWRRDFGNPRAFLLMCLTGRAATPWCWRQFGPPDTRKNSQIKTYALRPSQSAKANASGLPAPGAKVAVSKRPMPAAMRTYSIAVAYWSEKPNSFSTIIDAPQRHDRTLNGAFSPSNEGVPCGLRIGITR